MAKVLVPDDLWAVIAPLLPPERPKPKGGRPRVPDRAALTGILFVLTTGLPWEYLPQEPGCGSGMTCWRRLRDWQAAGVWQQLHHVLLDCLGEAEEIAWDRAAVGSASVPAPRGAGDRPQPDGSWQAGLQAPPRDRPPRPPARGRPGGGDRPRFADGGGGRRRHPAHPAAARAAEKAAGQAARRQGVRLPPLSAGAAPARHHAADRPAGD